MRPRKIFLTLIFTLSLSLLIGCTLPTITTTPKKSTETEGLAYALLSDDTYAVSLGTASAKDVVVPAEHNGTAVTAISIGGFEDCDAMESISLPASITCIKENALNGATSLTKIQFAGKKTAWNAIEKESGWSDDTGAYTVICSNGTLCTESHTWQTRTTVQPTATKKGYTVDYCTVCGRVTENDLTSHTHVWNNGSVTKQPTCTQKGVKTYTCTQCQETKTEDVALLDHDFATVLTYDTNNHYYSCSRCTEKKNSQAHTLNADAKASSAPTCGKAGTSVSKCTCGYTKTASVPATGNHTATTWTTTATAHSQTCSVCSTKFNSANHTFGTGVENGVSAASCATGTMTYTCSACSYVKTAPVESGKEHTPVIAYDTNGSISVTCSVCKRSLATMTKQASETFENKSVGTKISSLSTKSVVEQNATTKNKYAYWTDDCSSNNVPLNLTPSQTAIKDLTILALRVCLKFDHGGQTNTFSTLGINGKIDNVWGTDTNAPITVNASGHVVVAGLDTGVSVVKDSWYDIVIVYDKKNADMKAYCNGQGGEATAFASTGSFLSGKNWSYFTINIADNATEVLADDLALFTGNYTASTNIVHQHTLDAGTVIPDHNGEKLYTCTVCGYQEKPYVTYEEFGAKGDGKTDDFEAIYLTHAYANAHNLRVEGTPGANYYIGDITRTAIVMTDTDWRGATFTIDDSVVSYKGDTKSINIFTVQPATASYTVTPKTGMTLTKGQKNLGMTFKEDCLVLVENNKVKQFIRYGMNANEGAYQKEYLLVDKNGNVSDETPIQYDYSGVSRIVVYSKNETPITLKNGTFNTVACDPVKEATNNGETYTAAYYYYARGIRVDRSNTTLLNVKHYISDYHWDNNDPAKDGGAPYTGFYNIQNCANVTLRDCVATGHREYNFQQDMGGGKIVKNGMGSYDLASGGAVNLSLYNLRQSNNINDKANQHGLMGTNYCRNILLQDCYIDRFDAHSALYNVTIKDSTIGFGLYLIGGGTAYIENVTRSSENQFVYLRDDYGAVWFGDIILKDCHFTSSSAKYLVLGFWRSFDFGYDCVMGENLLVDNMECSKTLYAYYISKPESADASKDPLTDSINPFQAPKSIIFKNMKKIDLSEKGSVTASMVNTTTVKDVQYINCK